MAASVGTGAGTQVIESSLVMKLISACQSQINISICINADQRASKVFRLSLRLLNASLLRLQIAFPLYKVYIVLIAIILYNVHLDMR